MLAYKKDKRFSKINFKHAKTLLFRYSLSNSWVENSIATPLVIHRRRSAGKNVDFTKWEALNWDDINLYQKGEWLITVRCSSVGVMWYYTIDKIVQCLLYIYTISNIPNKLRHQCLLFFVRRSSLSLFFMAVSSGSSYFYYSTTFFCLST